MHSNEILEKNESDYLTQSLRQIIVQYDGDTKNTCMFFFPGAISIWNKAHTQTLIGCADACWSYLNRT